MKWGGYLKKKRKRALSEAINSKKKKKKKLIKIMSPSLLSFSKNKNKKNIKYKLSRYCGKCKRAENISASAHSCPRRGSAPRTEPFRKKYPA